MISNKESQNIISIIVPIFNAQQHLAACIDSILEQTYENFELILIDDGSSDDSSKICNRYGNIDSRIQLIHQNNSGVSIARNVGLHISKGKYIMFVDSDDTLNKNMIQYLLDVIKIQNVEMVVCGVARKISSLNAVKSIKSSVKYFSKDEALRSLLLRKEISDGPWARLIASDIAKSIDFDVSLQFAEDVNYNFHIIQHINKIAYIDTKLYNYRTNKASVSRSEFKVERMDGLKSIKQILEQSQTMENSNIALFAKARCFMEALYIGKDINNSLKYTKEYHECLSVVSKEASTVFSLGSVATTYRFIAMLAIVDARLAIFFFRIRYWLGRVLSKYLGEYS